MATTNKQAFMIYVQDEAKAVGVLNIRNIDPELSDKNAVSSAWGMVEKCMSSDYSQGRTSERFSTSARALMMGQAREILRNNGIFYFPKQSTVNGVIW